MGVSHILEARAAPQVYVGYAYMYVEHTGCWSVSLTSLPVRLNKLLICRGSGRSASRLKSVIHINGHSWERDLKQMLIAQQNFISHALFLIEFVNAIAISLKYSIP